MFFLTVFLNFFEDAFLLFLACVQLAVENEIRICKMGCRGCTDACLPCPAWPNPNQCTISFLRVNFKWAFAHRWRPAIAQTWLSEAAQGASSAGTTEGGRRRRAAAAWRRDSCATWHPLRPGRRAATASPTPPAPLPVLEAEAPPPPLRSVRSPSDPPCSASCANPCSVRVTPRCRTAVSG